MSTFQQITRNEKIAAVTGLVLFIGMIAFPWYSVSVPGYSIGGHSFGGASYTSNVLKGPGSFFSIVALIVLIAVLALVAARRLTALELPQLPVSWNAIEMYGAVAVLALLVIKILFHIGDFGWGFYLDMLLAIAFAVVMVMVSREAGTDQVPVGGPRHSSV
jgi:hypothetical protein